MSQLLILVQIAFELRRATKSAFVAFLPQKKGMSAFQFKTNINCGNCVRAVTGFLDDVKGLEEWSVDTDHPDKLLQVKGSKLQAQDVIEAVEEAGFDINLAPVN